MHRKKLEYFKSMTHKSPMGLKDFRPDLIAIWDFWLVLVSFMLFNCLKFSTFYLVDDLRLGLNGFDTIRIGLELKTEHN